MKKTSIVLAFMIVLGVSAAFAQQDITKVGVVDTSRVYTTFYRSATQVKNYETKKAEFQAEVDSLTQELKNLDTKLLSYEKSGDEVNKLKVQAEITKKRDYLTEYSRSKQLELESLKSKMIDNDEFYKKLYDAIGRIAESQGCSVVLSLQNANAILWYSSQIDITTDVINALTGSF